MILDIFLKNNETLKTDFLTGEQKPSRYTHKGIKFNMQHTTFKRNLIDQINLWSKNLRKTMSNYMYIIQNHC